MPKVLKTWLKNPDFRFKIFKIFGLELTFLTKIASLPAVHK